MGETDDQARLVLAGMLAAVIVVLALLGALVALVLAGRSTDDLFRLLNSGLNIIGVLTSGGAAALAQRAWRASSAGTRNLDQRIVNASYTAVDHALNERGAPAPTEPSLSPTPAADPTTTTGASA